MTNRVSSRSENIYTMLLLINPNECHPHFEHVGLPADHAGRYDVCGFCQSGQVHHGFYVRRRRLKCAHAEGSASVIPQRTLELCGVHDDLHSGKREQRGCHS